MFQDRNDLNKENAAWTVINDPVEIDDLMSLALRDLKRKFDESIESRFEQSLDLTDYPGPGPDPNGNHSGIVY